jgi:hypothetical protein
LYRRNNYVETNRNGDEKDDKDNENKNASDDHHGEENEMTSRMIPMERKAGD